eukprot:4748452-Pleurochrysis_carterae.AAC.2
MASIALSFILSSHAMMRRAVVRQTRGTRKAARADTSEMSSKIGVMFTPDACVTSVGFADSAGPSAREPLIQ